MIYGIGFLCELLGGIGFVICGWVGLEAAVFGGNEFMGGGLGGRFIGCFWAMVR